MGYLNDYRYYASGTECPENYLTWGGLSLLGAVLGRKVWTMHGDYFRIFTKLYVCFVGDAGSGKSTAKTQVKNFLRFVDPDYLVSASFQSHQDIIDRMANDGLAIKTWKQLGDKSSKVNEYRVFYAIANELNSLLSQDKLGMVAFLVDVFDDEDDFATGYKTGRLAQPERKQVVPYPYFNLLACAVPKWFMGNLKIDLFDGGLGRRLIIVYSDKTELKEHPSLPPGGEEAKDRAIAHLKLCALESTQGEIKKTPAAILWWKEWYHNKKRFNMEDPIISQFHQTKHIQALKVASLLSMCETPFTYKIEDFHLQAAVSMLDSLEPDIIRLTSGIGRNELAGISVKVLDYLQRVGMANSKQISNIYWRDVGMQEREQIENHLIENGKIKVVQMSDKNGVPIVNGKFYFSLDGYEEYIRNSKK
jgi:hypothetical protein